MRRMAQATTIVGLAKKLGVRRKLLYQWRDQLRQKAGRGWSDAEAGRQGASHRPFHRQYPVQPSCGLLNWNGC